jgi:hypothetical protein
LQSAQAARALALIAAISSSRGIWVIGRDLPQLHRPSPRSCREPREQHPCTATRPHLQFPPAPAQPWPWSVFSRQRSRSSRNPIHAGAQFRDLLVRHCYGLSLCSPPLSDQTRIAPSATRHVPQRQWRDLTLAHGNALGLHCKTNPSPERRCPDGELMDINRANVGLARGAVARHRGIVIGLKRD